jgi:hypothetical protein
MATAPPPSFTPDQRPASVPIWRESLAGLDWLALRTSAVFYGCGVSRGDGAAVVLVPGFLGTDWYLLELHGWLARIGYRPYLSRIGRNAECLDLLSDRLLETVETARRDTGRPVLIASVVTLGSPFRGVRSHPLVLLVSERVRARVRREERPDCYTGYCRCEAVTGLETAFPAAVPQLAVYTRTDGIVDWRMCVDDDPARNVEVTGTHVGLVANAAAYRAIAQHLAAAARPAPAASAS